MNTPLSVLALSTAVALGGGWMLTPTAVSAQTSSADAAADPAADAPVEAPAETSTEATPDNETGTAAEASGETTAETEGAAEAEDAAAETAAEIDTASIVDMAQGAEDAPVTVIEYASFTCPHCEDWHSTSYPQLKQDYIDSGKVRFVYREVYFDRPGLWASMIARCGGEQKYFGISDMLYEQQSQWAAGGDPAAIAANLRRIGLSAGLEEAQLDACMSDGRTAQTLVAWFEENATRDEITATPTFLINGEKHSNMAFADMAEIIDGLIEE